MLAPVADVKYTLLIVSEFALFGMGPANTAILYPILLHKLEDTVNGEKPLLVNVTLEDGLKIPILYKITATITMIRMAQPYVIIYSNADCDLLLFTERLG